MQQVNFETKRARDFWKTKNLYKLLNGEQDPSTNQAGNGNEKEDPVLNEAGPSNDGDVYLDEVVTTNLEHYLQNNSIGKEIIKAYNRCTANGKPLPTTVRSKLVRLVIAREKDWILRNTTANDVLEKFVIKKDRFLLLTNEIVTIFKGEYPKTYYFPPEQVGELSRPPGGKLWHHYNYMKQCLRDANLLAEPRSKKTHEQDVYLITNEDTNKLEWLLYNLDPWLQVVEYWTVTFEARRDLLKRETTSITDYLNHFPCLRQQQGLELILQDFNKLYKNTTFCPDEEWKIIKNCLINHLDSSTGIKDLSDLGLLKALKSKDLSNDTEDIIIFYLLPYIIGPKRHGFKRKSNNTPDRAKKLSLQERRESFLFIVETPNEVEPELEQFKLRLFKGKETFQPIILAIGSMPRISQYYVIVDEQKYTVDSPLKAVEAALKIFFSLDCRYPQNTQTIWTFLQKILLKIDLREDVVNTDSNILLGYIKDLLTK